MKNNLENNDWKDEAPYLAGLEIKNPFVVPEGYFETLSGQLEQAIFLEKLKTADPGFEVPPAYFEHLPGHIEQTVFLNELKTAEPGFEIPPAYFEQLPEHIEQRIFLETLKTTEPNFEVPPAYFEGLSNAIESRIAVDQLKTQVQDPGFGMPAGYFDRLQTAIQNQTTTTAGPKKPVLKLWRSNLLRYASAACFVLISATAFYFYPRNTAEQPISVEAANEQMLYDIDESTILDHIQSSTNEQQKPAVPDTELENYILSNYSQSDIASNL